MKTITSVWNINTGSQGQRRSQHLQKHGSLPPLISCSWIIHFHLHPSISLSFLLYVFLHWGKPRAHEVASHEPLIWIWLYCYLHASCPSMGPQQPLSVSDETKRNLQFMLLRQSGRPLNTRKRFLSESAHIDMHQHKLTFITDDARLFLMIRDTSLILCSITNKI